MGPPTTCRDRAPHLFPKLTVVVRPEVELNRESGLVPIISTSIFLATIRLKKKRRKIIPGIKDSASTTALQSKADTRKSEVSGRGKAPTNSLRSFDQPLRQPRWRKNHTRELQLSLPVRHVILMKNIAVMTKKHVRQQQSQ